MQDQRYADLHGDYVEKKHSKKIYKKYFCIS